MKWLKNLFGKKDLPKAVCVQPSPDTTMVGEPVLSFVKCLQNNPKRFKLKVRPRAEAAEFGGLFSWMTLDTTGFYSLTDKFDGSVYRGVFHKGTIYRVEGLKFSLNGWELNYLTKAFFNFRMPAKKRQQRINQSACERWYAVKNAEENKERQLMMEKFK